VVLNWINMTEKSKNILLFSCSVIFSLLIIEGFLRTLELEDYTLPIRLNENGFVTHKFNLDKMRYDGENKKKVHIKTNNEGFVGPDYQIAKPNGTLRVAVFGDSFTEAMQVDYEKTFPYLLEKKLKNKVSSTYSNVEVLNFGTGGTGTGDAMLFYHTYARKYNPNLVILAFYLGNDVDDNSKYYALKDKMLLDQNNWDNVTPPDAAARKSFVGIKDVVFRSSAIIRFLDRVFRSSVPLRTFAQQIGLYRPPLVESNQKLTKYDYYYMVPPDEDHKKYITYTSELINNFSKQVQVDGKKFAVLFIPQGMAVHPKDYFAYINERPGLSTSTFSLQYLEDTIVSGLNASTTILHLAPFFSSIINAGNKELYLVNGQGHFNEDAHPIVSDLLVSTTVYMLQNTK